MSPPKLGTIWPAVANIRYIDDSRKQLTWVTVAQCMDTPAAIAKAVEDARKKHPLKTLWIFDINGRRIAR